jgi:hypothetical protein
MLVIVGNDMSISKVEEELVQIKEDFSRIPAVRTSKPEPAPVKKRSRSGLIAALAVIVILILVLVYVLLL